MQAERRKFKEHEDAKFWKHKQRLKSQATAGLAHGKDELAALHSRNQKHAAGYKKELALMKELRTSQREDWANFGHELTIEFGQELVDRVKAETARAAEAKLLKGAEVRREEKRLERQLASQRADALEEARQHVAKLKEEKIGKTEEVRARACGASLALDAASRPEPPPLASLRVPPAARQSMNFALRSRQEKVDSVKRTEASWKVDQTKSKEAFLGHAHSNKERAQTTLESMRSSRKTLIKSHNSTVREERQRKEDDAALIAQRRQETDHAKQRTHDQIFAQRRVSPEKQRTVREISRAKSPKKAARKAGLVQLSERAPSPYKIY